MNCLFRGLAIIWLVASSQALAAENASTPGRVFKDCARCPQMAVIPGGSFLMGSPASAKARYENEGPQHRVAVSRFAIGKYEVTFAEWDVCVAAGGCRHRPDDRGWGRGRRPVIYVSWRDARQYVAWLSRRTGKRYRLPSEAEWEYAARAGTRTVYSWGNAIGLGKANCRGCGSRRGEKKTAPVGSFRPNRFGLYDLHGNASEWVEDCRHKSYVGAPADGRPWTTGGDCRFRILRGGSWASAPRDLRSALRSWGVFDGRLMFFGFRVAKTLP
jgi:formylglycine-generating enzyme required for sulfatase activity